MKYRLIVIDDEPLITEQFKMFTLWEKSDFELVECFDNAEEAIDYLYDNHVDLAICDIKMPDFDGMEFTKYCSEHFKDLNVVLLSACTDFEYARAAIQYGVKDYLVKPITRSKLEITLNKISRELTEREEHRLAEHSETFKLQCIFMDILSGEIVGKNELTAAFQNIGISQKFMKNDCTMFVIKINNLDEYLSSKWKYGRERFYNAISYVCNHSAQNYCVCSVHKSYDEHECLVVSKNRYINGFNDCLKVIRDTLRSMFKLEIECEVIGSFGSIVELTDDKNRLIWDKEKTGADADIIEKINSYLEKNYHNCDLDRDTVAREVYLNSTYFSAIFKQKNGRSFVDALNNIRIEKSKAYVVDKSIKISSIHKYVGYKDSKYFMKMFKKITGKTPMEYRNGVNS